MRTEKQRANPSQPCLPVAALTTTERNRITGQIVDAAMRVHSKLGPGLLESAYEACLAYELRKRGFKALTQVGLSVSYDEVQLDVGYRIDLLVEDEVIVEARLASAA